MQESPNVFVLTVDSLQYPAFASASRRISDQLGAVEFTDAVATASHTASAMPGLAAGVYHDSIPTRPLPEEGGPTTLAEALADAGYECGLWSENVLFGTEYNYDGGFTGGNQGVPNTKRQVADALESVGIDALDNAARWGYYKIYKPVVNRLFKGDRGDFYTRASTWHDQALSWLERTRRPQLCWIHYMDTHHPYEPTPEYFEDLALTRDWSRTELGEFSRTIIADRETATDEELADIDRVYRACCDYLADDVVAFVKETINRGHFNPETDVFVLTADHGELLDPDEAGMMGHTPPAFWEPIVNVPLVVVHPNWEPATVNQQVSLVDVMPTVLRAAGIDVPETADGTAAATPEDLYREFAFAISQPYVEDGEQRTYRAVRTDDGWKLFGADRDQDAVILTQFDHDGERVVFETTPDRLRIDSPTEPEHRRQFERLRERLDAVGGPVEVENAAGQRSEELDEHLRDLGYLE